MLRCADPALVLSHQLIRATKVNRFAGNRVTGVLILGLESGYSIKESVMGQW
jgi:hypothetical protein